MSRPRSVHQLILLSDGHYLSPSTASLSLRMVSYNADAHALTYARAVFEWQDAGTITAKPPFVLALPVLSDTSYTPSRSTLSLGSCTDITVTSPLVWQQVDIASYPAESVCMQPQPAAADAHTDAYG